MHRLAVGQLIKLCARHCQINRLPSSLGMEKLGSFLINEHTSPLSSQRILAFAAVNGELLSDGAEPLGTDSESARGQRESAEPGPWI